MKILNIKYYILLVVLISSCTKFVEIDPPRTALERGTVFANQETAEAAVRGIYFTLNGGSSWSSFAGGIGSVTFLSALSADETENSSGDASYVLFENNTLLSTTTFLSELWNQMYETIYKANAVIEGGNNSEELSSALKSKFEGEAKVIRAFCHFYLANLFGDVALILTTDYKINNVAGRTAVADIYEQVITDLKDAQTLLQPSYNTGTIERVRIDWGAATALLARVYLYKGDWANAEIQATDCINAGPYSLQSNLDNVFLKGSSEAIWQLSNDKSNSGDAIAFIKNKYVVLRQDLLNGFEAGDKRRVNWITGITNTANYITNKHKAASSSPITEYQMVFRLAEQYLIRAEARMQQSGKIAEGIVDLNILRTRARATVTAEVPNPLPALSTTMSKNDALAALEQERRIELFTEWGHRWFDLKRTGRVDAVIGALKPSWTSTAALYPLPQNQLLNSDWEQNPGYDE
ncbi:MAG: RagB/SusD family nutrient uptake outer membrane protein [Bacteroidales bacterium]|nr:RagB/SusD family nutrient uptake outer membrane protein [Bacteroidales bacterium]MDD3990319.1 RagB/SusD family nutrient uptake outer membrane protein [Bacteroidales bacterium]